MARFEPVLLFRWIKNSDLDLILSWHCSPQSQPPYFLYLGLYYLYALDYLVIERSWLNYYSIKEVFSVSGLYNTKALTADSHIKVVDVGWWIFVVSSEKWEYILSLLQIKGKALMVKWVRAPSWDLVVCLVKHTVFVNGSWLAYIKKYVAAIGWPPFSLV